MPTHPALHLRSPVPFVPENLHSRPLHLRAPAPPPSVAPLTYPPGTPIVLPDTTHMRIPLNDPPVIIVPTADVLPQPYNPLTPQQADSINKLAINHPSQYTQAILNLLSAQDSVILGIYNPEHDSVIAEVIARKGPISRDTIDSIVEIPTPYPTATIRKADIDTVFLAVYRAPIFDRDDQTQMDTLLIGEALGLPLATFNQIDTIYIGRTYTGIPEQSLRPVRLWYDPRQSTLHLPEPQPIEVYNIAGQRIRRTRAKILRLAEILRGYPSGTYLLKTPDYTIKTAWVQGKTVGIKILYRHRHAGPEGIVKIGEIYLPTHTQGGTPDYEVWIHWPRRTLVILAHPQEFWTFHTQQEWEGPYAPTYPGSPNTGAYQAITIQIGKPQTQIPTTIPQTPYIDPYNLSVSIDLYPYPPIYKRGFVPPGDTTEFITLEDTLRMPKRTDYPSISPYAITIDVNIIRENSIQGATIIETNSKLAIPIIPLATQPILTGHLQTYDPENDEHFIDPKEKTMIDDPFASFLAIIRAIADGKLNTAADYPYIRPQGADTIWIAYHGITPQDTTHWGPPPPNTPDYQYLFGPKGVISTLIKATQQNNPAITIIQLEGDTTGHDFFNPQRKQHNLWIIARQKSPPGSSNPGMFQPIYDGWDLLGGIAYFDPYADMRTILKEIGSRGFNQLQEGAIHGRAGSATFIYLDYYDWNNLPPDAKYIVESYGTTRTTTLIQWYSTITGKRIITFPLTHPDFRNGFMGAAIRQQYDRWIVIGGESQTY